MHERGELLRLESDQTLGYLQFREGSTTRAILGFGDEADLLVNALPNSFAIDGQITALHFAVDSDASKGITIDTLGNVQSSFATPGGDSRGLTWDGSSLWLVEGTGSMIYELSTTGTI